MFTGAIDVRVVQPTSYVADVLTPATAGKWTRPLPASLEGHAVKGAAPPRPAADGAVDSLDFCMCNPPFFEDVKEANGNPRNANTGTASETAVDGGELAFVRGILKDATTLRQHVTWFTTLLGKKATFVAFLEDLKANGVTMVKTNRFAHGTVFRWVVVPSQFAAHVAAC